MDALQADILLRTATARRRTRRALATVLVVTSFIGSAIFWLATTGTTGPTIGVPAGTLGGEVANVTAMTSEVTRTNGAAQLQSGIALERILVAKDSDQDIRVVVAWLNPHEAQQVLNNPNAQIAIGVYHPINTGTCEGGDPSTAVAVDDNLDGNFDGTKDFCAALDTGSVSRPPFDDGRLLLARDLQTGYLRPSMDATATPSTCAATGTTWCQPSELTTDGALEGDERDQRAMYVIASITVPGGRPVGQQTNLNELDFFVQVKRI